PEPGSVWHVLIESELATLEQLRILAHKDQASIAGELVICVGAAERKPNLVGSVALQRCPDRFDPCAKLRRTRRMRDECRDREFVPSMPIQRPIATLVS